MARSIRRSGSTSACIINTASAGAPGWGIIFTIARLGRAERAATQYEYPQGSACFIQSVEDTMEDIMRLAMSEAMLFKYGSGTGTDLSSLRSTREKLSGGGKPSGPLSFLKVYDQVANVVKSGGKTRRAAKMNTLKDWHPGHRGIHRREAEGREEGVGADRAGLRRQLQRRRLRLGHVSERKPERARERRVHGCRGGRSRMVDAAGARRQAVRTQGGARRCCAKSPKAPTSAAIPGCSSIPPSTNGTPAKAPTGRIPPTRARNISSSTTRPAISLR